MRSRWGFSFWGASHAAMGGFQVSSLFAASEPGFLYDPSDISTLFQDAAGTTPVTAAGQSVGLMLDKSRGLVLGPELVTNGDFSGGTTGWTANANATISVVAGALVLTATAASPAAYKSVPTEAGKWYKFTAQLASDAMTGNSFLSVGTYGGSNDLLLINANSAAGVYTGYFKATGSTSYVSASGSSTALAGETISIDNISVRELPGNHATQPTSLSRPTYQVDSNGRGHLLFDGSDDFLVTPTITPGTDKAQVFAGVRKLSDAATGVVAELSATLNLNNGTLLLAAPVVAGTPDYSFSSKGTTGASQTRGGFASPRTDVLTALADISGPSVQLRVSSNVVAAGTGDQGTGNYLAYPIYIGRRGGTLLPFNGRIYSLICRFGPNLTADQIAQTEAWVNSKTGAY